MRYVSLQVPRAAATGEKVASWVLHAVVVLSPAMVHPRLLAGRQLRRHIPVATSYSGTGFGEHRSG